MEPPNPFSWLLKLFESAGVYGLLHFMISSGDVLKVATHNYYRGLWSETGDFKSLKKALPRKFITAYSDKILTAYFELATISIALFRKIA